MEDKQIKVLHIDTEMSWRGGQQQAVFLYSGMVERGYPTKFICCPGSRLQEHLKSNQLEHDTINFNHELDIWAGWKLANYARRHKYSILQLHSGHAHSWGLLAKIFYPKLKLVATRRVSFPVRKHALSRLKYTTKSLNSIVAVSSDIRQILVKDGIPQHKIKVVHSGVDLVKCDICPKDPNFRKQWNIPHEAIVVGTAAAFSREKDYPNYLRAAAWAIQNEPSLYFMAVGEGALFPQMKELAKQMNIGNRVIFTGQQSEVVKFMKAWDIFVLASKGGEGFNNAVLQAMATGLPVIATQVGGIREMIEPGVTGILVMPSNQKMLGEAIVNIARDPKLRQSLGHSAQEAVRAFDKENMVDQYLEIYRGL